MLKINKEIDIEIVSLLPSIDKDSKFLFYGNHKVCLQSVDRGVLNNRTITIKKIGLEKYQKLYQSINKNDMFKFTIVRNPWDRTVSAFTYLQKMGIIKDNDFCHFIKNTDIIEFNIHFHKQYNRAFCEGEQFVDFIGRLENIEEDWKYIASKIACPNKLPHKNKTKHKYYTEYYDGECKQIISDIYAEDIELFGYKF